MEHKSRRFVQVKQVDWRRDSHGLFDYESKNVKCNKTEIRSSSKLVQEGEVIVSKPIMNDFPQLDQKDSDCLFFIIGDGTKNEFILKAPPLENYDDNKQNPFVVVRSIKDDKDEQKGYTLEPGDILRLGRIEYKVIEYQDSEKLRHSLFDTPELLHDETFHLTTKVCVSASESNRQCRICFARGGDIHDELVNPCACKGINEYVHVQCLQTWINSRARHRDTPESLTWCWRNLRCELCKVILPDVIRVDDRCIQLVPTYRPETPYILLVRVFYDKSKSIEDSKMIILSSIKHETYQLKIGRSHERDIRDNDISISRLHAFIDYKVSKFTITDNKSKFGTLALLRRDFNISEKKLAIQLGKTVITLAQKESNLEEGKECETQTEPELTSKPEFKSLIDKEESKNSRILRKKIPGRIQKNTKFDDAILIDKLTAED